MQRGRLKLDIKQKCIQLSAYKLFHSDTVNGVPLTGLSTACKTVDTLQHHGGGITILEVFKKPVHVAPGDMV